MISTEILQTQRDSRPTAVAAPEPADQRAPDGDKTPAPVFSERTAEMLSILNALFDTALMEAGTR